MREMKDSGVQWIGEIPSTWEIMRIKALPDRSVTDSFVDGDWIESPHITDEGIRYLTTGNVGDGKYKEQGAGYISETTFEELHCKYAYPGDFVISRLNAPYGRACILPDAKDKYVLAVDIVILRTNEDKRYLCYLSQCSGYQHSVEDMARGTAMKRISRNNLGTVRLPIPPIEEQHCIADYLDNKCSQVDTLIANVQVQIEKLKAYKQSVITEVVTKGLDPTVPVKDSGVEWIGEIPEPWDIIKLKYVTHISRGLFNHRPRNDPQFYDGEYPFIQTGDVARAQKYITTYSQTLNERGKSVSKQFPKGTMAMTIAANVGDVAILGFDAYFPDSVVGFTVKDGFDENYVYYLFQALKESFVRASIASTQLNLNIERSKEIVVSVTYDEHEQKRIADFLDTKCDQIDRLIALKQSKIEKLEQYKKSLIYEYVTGKKEVS